MSQPFGAASYPATETGAGAGVETERVNSGDLYHRLGKLEGVLETVASSLSSFTSHIESVENRLLQRQTEAESRQAEWRGTVDARLQKLERTDASTEGGVRMSGWLLTAVGVPVLSGLLVLASQGLPSFLQNAGGSGDSHSGQERPQSGVRP
jgi:hypothetical protein